MMLLLALPGTAYIYQGQELGLEEVREIAPEQRQDPIFKNSGGTVPGRDGCRVPLPWTKSGKSFGFGPEDGADAWLPMPAHWTDISAEAQQSDPDSMWNLTRTALLLRRQLPLLGSGDMRWRDDLVESDRVLAFERHDELSASSVVCVVNFGDEDVTVPALSLLLASVPEVAVHHGFVEVPANACVWIVL
jgi:alpha-glucosidase